MPTRVQVDKVPGPSRLQVSQVTPDTYARPAVDPNAGADFLTMANALAEFRPGLNKFLDVKVKEAQQKDTEQGFADRMAAKADPNASQAGPKNGGFYARAWNEADAILRAEDYSTEVFNTVRNSPLWNKENADPEEFEKTIAPIRQKYSEQGKAGGVAWTNTFGQKTLNAESQIKTLWLNRLQQVRQDQAVSALTIAASTKLIYSAENPHLSPEQIAGILQTEVDNLSTKFNVDKGTANRAVAEGFKSFFTQMTRDPRLYQQFDRYMSVFKSIQAGTGPLANTSYGHEVLDHAYNEQYHAESFHDRLEQEQKKTSRNGVVSSLMDYATNLNVADLATREEPPTKFMEDFVRSEGSASFIRDTWRMLRESRLNPVAQEDKDRLFELQAKFTQNPETVDPEQARNEIIAAKTNGSISPQSALELLKQVTNLDKQTAMLGDQEYKGGLAEAATLSVRAEADLKNKALTEFQTRLTANPQYKSLMESGEDKDRKGKTVGPIASLYQEFSTVDLTPAVNRARVAYTNSISGYLKQNGLVWESLNAHQKLEAVAGARQAYADMFTNSTNEILANTQNTAEKRAGLLQEINQKAADIAAKAKQTLSPDGQLTFSSASELKSYGGLYRWFYGVTKDAVSATTGFAQNRTALTHAYDANKTNADLLHKSQDLNWDGPLTSNPAIATRKIGVKNIAGLTDQVPELYGMYVQYNKGRARAASDLPAIKAYIAENTTFAQEFLKNKGTGWWHPIDAQTADSLGDAIQALQNYRVAFGMEDVAETLKIPAKDLDPTRMLLVPIHQFNDANMEKVAAHLGITSENAYADFMKAQSRLYQFHRAMTNNPSIEKMGPDIREYIEVSDPNVFPQLKDKPYTPKNKYEGMQPQFFTVR